MKTLNLHYQDALHLTQFIQNHQLSQQEHLLIQVFTGQCDENFITTLVEQLKHCLPKAKIIGSTTDGEILNGKIMEKQTVLSFSSFEHTSIETYGIAFQEDSFQTGEALLKSIPTLVNANLLITFTQGLTINGEEYLKAFNTHAPQLIIAGGLASDNATFTGTFVFTQEGIFSNGAVAAILYSKRLFINTHYNFSWEPVGQELTVTKSVKNRVYTINDIPAADVYTKYLGDKIGQMLPATGIEFPLVIPKNNLDIARAVLEKHPDGSLSFAGNINQGDKVKFAYGNIRAILDQAPVCSQKVSSFPVESIFIYSCMARKRLLGQNIETELSPLQDIAPTSGFFTNGEFFHNKRHHNELLNQTMTLVSLSESTYIAPQQLSKTPLTTDERSHTISALSHLISVTSAELQALNEDLEHRVKTKTDAIQKLNASLEVRIEEKTQALKQQYESLHQAQKQLIENEKYTSLGTLVAGVAHEINTPVGLSLTGITHLDSELRQLQKIYNNAEMTEEDFTKYIDHSSKLIASINSSLVKAASLVKSFKQVAVDQSSQENREFNLHTYIDEILLSLHNKTRLTKHTIDNTVPKNISIYSNPGSFSQIITNLVLNAIFHAFEDKSQEGTITISATKTNHQLILKVQDDGIGLTNEVKDKLFDPFFTTKRGSGGSGLGMNIIFNIVTHTLKGDITIDTLIGKGTTFSITIPLTPKP